MKNILVINGHQKYPFAEGRLNQILFENTVEFLSSKFDVDTTVMSKGFISEEEQDKFKAADAVIFQFPVFWYSVPGLFKTYIDKVYAPGIFFDPTATNNGDGGLLKGKKYMFSMTMCSPEDAFNNPNSFLNGKSLDDVFLPLHKTHQFCGMEQIKTFAVYDVVQNPNVLEFIENLSIHIKEEFSS